MDAATFPIDSSSMFFFLLIVILFVGDGTFGGVEFCSLCNSSTRFAYVVNRLSKKWQYQALTMGRVQLNLFVFVFFRPIFGVNVWALGLDKQLFRWQRGWQYTNVMPSLINVLLLIVTQLIYCEWKYGWRQVALALIFTAVEDFRISALFLRWLHSLFNFNIDRRIIN